MNLTLHCTELRPVPVYSNQPFKGHSVSSLNRRTCFRANTPRTSAWILVAAALTKRFLTRNSCRTRSILRIQVRWLRQALWIFGAAAFLLANSTAADLAMSWAISLAQASARLLFFPRMQARSVSWITMAAARDKDFRPTLEKRSVDLGGGGRGASGVWFRRLRLGFGFSSSSRACQASGVTISPSSPTGSIASFQVKGTIFLPLFEEFR
mmetsp:Transcript_15558/g.36826  ORF Transcript_15558/g.36826 Transcript_15558/m.36826 type:complete len:210 (-) Transcript_15558:1371-2000(-)